MDRMLDLFQPGTLGGADTPRPTLTEALTRPLRKNEVAVFSMKENELTELAKAFEQKLSHGPRNPVPESILKEIRERKEKEIEMRFSIADRYAKKLFIALARKHGFKPYRYPRQKHTTVNLKGKKSYFDRVLWPEFLELSNELDFFLDQITYEIVRNVLSDDISEITVPTSKI